MAATKKGHNSNLKRGRQLAQLYGGMIKDSCRECGKEIIRKAQNRPRICLECDRKNNARPINDKCRICGKAIVRSNVRKARICSTCKTEKEKEKKREAEPRNSIFLPSGCKDSRKVYSIRDKGRARFEFLRQYFQLSEALLHYYGHPIPQHQWFTDKGNLYDSDLRPSYSFIEKVDTDTFPSPEDVISFLLQRKQTKVEDIILPKTIERKNPQTPILVPHVNPYSVPGLVDSLQSNRQSLLYSTVVGEGHELMAQWNPSNIEINRTSIMKSEPDWPERVPEHSYVRFNDSVLIDPYVYTWTQQNNLFAASIPDISIAAAMGYYDQS